MNAVVAVVAVAAVVAVVVAVVVAAVARVAAVLVYVVLVTVVVVVQVCVSLSLSLVVADLVRLEPAVAPGLVWFGPAVAADSVRLESVVGAGLVRLASVVEDGLVWFGPAVVVDLAVRRGLLLRMWGRTSSLREKWCYILYKSTLSPPLSSL